MGCERQALREREGEILQSFLRHQPSTCKDTVVTVTSLANTGKDSQQLEQNQRAKEEGKIPLRLNMRKKLDHEKEISSEVQPRSEGHRQGLLRD